MSVEFYFAIASILAFLLFILTLVRTRGQRPEAIPEEVQEAAPRQPLVQRRPDVPRNIRSRVRNRRQQQERRTEAAELVESSGVSDDDDDLLAEELDFSGQKIGAKKRKKLELKAEKKAAREAELREREDKKERQERLEEERRKKDEMEEELEKKKEEEERKRKEEEEKREQEEYEAMKAQFEVEEEGYEENIDEDELENQLQKFINYIKATKVVVLEDIASQFRLKTQEVIDRITTLQNDGTLTGVIDDRGKFIYICMEELEAVAKFIKQRGRLSITELADASNTLINLNPDTSQLLQQAAS